MKLKPWIKLSYDLTETDPVPPGISPISVVARTSILRGDISNTSDIHMCNHIGTHMDTPLHFCADGFALTDLDINCFYFSNPRLIDLPLGDAELIRPGHLEQFESLIGDCDLLLLRTGFGAIRSTDQQRYIMDGPGFSEEGAAYLADSFPDLRCLALDTISLVAMRELDEGIRAHQALLGGGREYLIIEDVNLDQDLSGISEVVALPLMIRGIDGGPCTIVAR